MAKAFKRMMKKQEEEELEKLAKEPVPPPTLSSAKPNPFAMMARSNRKESSSSESEEEKVESGITGGAPLPPNAKPLKPKASKPKKKKKAKVTIHAPQEELPEPELRPAEPVEEAPKSAPQDEAGESNVLKIFVQNFNYKKELQKHFQGLKVSEGPEGLGRKKPAFIPPNMRPSKKSAFVYSEESLIRPQDALEMKLVREGNGIQLFTLKMSTRQLTQEQNYVEVRNFLDINITGEYLSNFPYQPHALYDMAEYYRSKSITKEALMLFEKLLLFYEESMPHWFELLAGEELPCKFLESESIGSRLFFQTLLKFSVLLGSKGCYASALEFSKVLLRLDPKNDPLGALAILPAFALCAEKTRWLASFARSFASQFYSEDSSISLLPNVLCSLALSGIDQEAIAEVQKVCTLDSLKRLKELEICPEKDSRVFLLMLTIVLYPSIITEILTDTAMINLNPKAPWFKDSQRKNWTDLVKHPLLARKENFNYAFLGVKSSEEAEGARKLIILHSALTKQALRSEEVNIFLKGVVGFLVDCIEKNFFDPESILIKASSELVFRDKKVPFSLTRYAKLTGPDFVDDENLPENQAPQANAINMNQNWLRLFVDAIMPWNNIPNQGGQQNDQID